MTRLLVNCTEQEQPDERNDTLFKLYCRRAEDPSERIELTVFGLDPHFYSEEDFVSENESYLLEQDCIDRIEYGEWEGLHGEDLARIYTPYPQNTRDARELVDEHWNADVPFTRRLRIDSGLRAEVEVPDSCAESGTWDVHYRELNPVEPDLSGSNPGGNGGRSGLQNVDPRVVFVDIEVDDRGEGFPDMGDERVLSIVAHDSYDEEVRGFIDLHGRDPAAEFPDGAPGDVDALEVVHNEVDLFDKFVDWFSEKNPDLVSGWNVDDFDIPYIIERMDNLNANPSRLSPLGWSGISSRGEARIKGRTVYDLLEVYKKNSFTELRSYSLEDVAEEELDSEKVQFEGGYYQLYEEDPVKFVNYNARDVTLCRDINREAGVIEFRDILRREVGVDFEDSYDNKDFVDMMCRRKLKERGLVGPSRPAYGEEADSDYEGAVVFDPYKGVAENVVGIDLASLYPYTMAMLNASPETHVTGPVTNDFGLELTEPDGTHGGEVPVCKASNDEYFRLDQDGIFREMVDEAISLKSDYKEARDSAETDEEYEKWSEKYNVAKTLTNSLYGVTGWERFFLYDEAVAEAVTLTGQTVIKRTAEYVEDTGYDVIYGDSVPDFEPVTIRNAHGDINVVPIEEAWEKFEQGRRFQVWCDSGWANVKNAIRKPNRKDMYRVRTGDGVVHVTEDHGLLRPDGTEVTPTEISVGDELMHTPHNHPSFESTSDGTDEDTAWLWGLFAGDGTCGTYKDKNGDTKRQWKISGDTRKSLERAANVLKEKGYTPRVEYIDSDNHTGRLLVSEVSEMVNRHRHKFYTKNGKKRVPRSILNGTDHAKRAFLEGYQAADGDKDDRYDKLFHRSHTNSETLAQGVAVLLQSLGRQCGVNVRDNYGKEYTRIWSRQTGGGPVVKEVERVEYTGDYVYDLSTESEHFNAGVGTITVHNTDSTYIRFPEEWSQEECLTTARELCQDLNETIYPELAESMGIPAEDNLWEIEVEAHMERFFQAGKKKRYAYLPTWKDGRQLEDPEPSISGFSSKRSDSAELTVDTEEEIFNAILHGHADQVSEIVYEAAREINPDSPDWERIGIPGGMNKKITNDPKLGDRDEYYAVSCNSDGKCYPQDAHPRAVWNANQILSVRIDSNDKPKRVYLREKFFEEVGRQINVIAFNENKDLSTVEDMLLLDAARMTETILCSPLREVLDAVDVDVDAAVRGQEQLGLAAFEQ